MCRSAVPEASSATFLKANVSDPTILHCTTSVKDARHRHCGVYFDVVNRSDDEEVIVLGFSFASYGGCQPTTLYAEQDGRAASCDRWKQAWSGDLQDTATDVQLREPLHLSPGDEQRFFLFSLEEGILLSEPGASAEDEVLHVRPGCFAEDCSWEPRHNCTYTPAGAVKYATSPEPLHVVSIHPTPSSDGRLVLSCTSLGGTELGRIDVHSGQTSVEHLRLMLMERLQVPKSRLRLALTNGTLLRGSDAQKPLAEFFGSYAQQSML